jgi:hypothetical protein
MRAIRISIKYILNTNIYFDALCFSKNFLVSATTTPLNANSAIILGSARQLQL